MSGYLLGIVARARGEGPLLRPLPRMHYREPAPEVDSGPPAATAEPAAGARHADPPADGAGPLRAARERPPQEPAARARDDTPDPGRPLPRSPVEPGETGATDLDAGTSTPAEPPRVAWADDPPAHTAPRPAGEARVEPAGRMEPLAVPARRGPRNVPRRDRRPAAERPATVTPVRPVWAPVREVPAPEAAPEPITVSIGRVEIRAAVPQPVAAPSIREPRQSLDEYLRAREGGRER